MSLNLSMASSTRDGSYSDALSRFDQQTEELKKLLAEEEEDVSTTSLSGGDSSDEEQDSGEEEEDSDEDSEEDSDEDSSDDDDSSDYDSDDSDWDSDYEDLEAELTGQQPIKKVNSSPALMAMDASMSDKQQQVNVMPGFINMKDRMRRQSGSYLQSPEYSTKTVPQTVDNPFASTKPEDHLQHILEGFSAARFPSETWHDYFLTMTDEHIEAHTTEVERAIRSHDYETLRRMLRNGHTLQTCNKHGESIIHIACRRGTTELLQFLIDEAHVSTRIRDDMGRTPLHDACWSHKPNFEIVMELLRVSPELLFIIDKRGFTPLTYVPREAWGKWCNFLQDHRQFLRDMVKSLRYDRARYFVKTMVPCLKF